MEENKNKNKSAMVPAALTLGIISIVFAIFWYISLPSGILAIVFGVKTRRRFGSKIGTAGMITGIVGLSVLALFYIGMLGLIFSNI